MCSDLIFAVVLLAGSAHPSSAGTEPGHAFQTDARPERAAQEDSQSPAGQEPAKESDAPQAAKPSTDAPAAEKAEPASVSPKQSSAGGVRKRHKGGKKLTPPDAEGEPRKIVIHRGGTSDPGYQILPGISPEEAVHQRESAEQLLAAADSSVKQLTSRSLNLNQQEIVVQIRQYIEAARSALKEPDTQRAHTLALKAYLLADDLVKH